jgi:zinc-ribbon domain
MSGLLRRLTRRGPATADENRSPTAGSSETAAAPADAPPTTGEDRPVPADEQQTRVLPASAEEPPAARELEGAGSAAGGAAVPAEPEASPASEQDSPGARWATGATTEQPVAKTEATEQPAAKTEAEAKQTTGEQPTTFAAQPAPVRDLPAGVDASDLSSAPAVSSRRGKLRRRLRYLRHVRELLLRDLGGFTYEIHRTAGGAAQEGHRRLADAKANRIAALDAEVGAIEARLGEPHAETVLREAGIGGTCPECGELHASDAHFCSRCGTPLDAKARARREAFLAAAAQPTPEPQPASVLWAGGPRPAGQRDAEDESEQPSSVTSQWLLQPTTFSRAAEPTPADPSEPGARAADAAKPHESAPTPDQTAADAPAAGEPATTSEPATGEPPAANESATTDDPATVAGPAPANEAVADETATSTEPAAAHEPAAADEPATPDERVADAPADEAVAADDAAADDRVADAPADESVAADDAAADEAAADLPAADESAPDEQRAASERLESGPNGRRDDDVPRPMPFASRRGEQR